MAEIAVRTDITRSMGRIEVVDGEAVRLRLDTNEARRLALELLRAAEISRPTGVHDESEMPLLPGDARAYRQFDGTFSIETRTTGLPWSGCALTRPKFEAFVDTIRRLLRNA